MAIVVQYLCSSSIPLARAVRSRAFSIKSLPIVKNADSHVLLGMSEPDLQQLALNFGQQSYRGKQLHQLLYKRKVKQIQEFTHLPLSFRNDLEEAGWTVGRSPIHKAVTATDGTIKLLIKLEDGRLVETVGIPVEDKKGSVRVTACVSSQVGCPLRCSFCATGKGGFSRNLRRHEIVEQVLAIEELFKRRVTNVVFMGMGEPMLNLKEALGAHQCLNKDVQIGQRMMTISTVGVPNTIKKLASHKLQSTLALSLHAPNQKLREQIVPSAKSYPLNAIMKDCRDYFLETSRRVSFEYTLLAGVNDAVEHAKELAELLNEWGRGHHVNLIPFNPVEGTEYRRPYRKAKPGTKVLYLGADSYTTVSHLSDIVGTSGMVYAVTSSPCPHLENMKTKRVNVVPIVGDVMHPTEYIKDIEPVDVILSEFSVSCSGNMMDLNASSLKVGGHFVLLIKAIYLRSDNPFNFPGYTIAREFRILRESILPIRAGQPEDGPCLCYGCIQIRLRCLIML